MTVTVVEILAPTAPREVVEVLRDDDATVIEIEVPGPQGSPGPPGPPGTDPDLPDMTTIFENGLF